MAEYIEREALLNALSESTEPFNVASVFRTIKRQSKADVAPVRHGRWERYHEADVGWDEWGLRCTNCGLEVEDKDFTFPEKFCPNCGAWMDLEDEVK